jgi:AcrR family transcriptional regulator
LEAAGRLLDAAEDPAAVSVEAIAAAAGVGKGTIFRRFGSRADLIVAVFEGRAAQLLESISAVDQKQAAETRAIQILWQLVTFKRDNRVVSAAIEASDGNPYHRGAYERWHALFTELITEAKGPVSADFLAHSLLAATRTDLIHHLAAWSDERLYAGIRTLVTSVFRTEP